jgi:hypothetical protein
MQKVSLGFSTTNYPLSILIRWITKSKTSHTWLLVEENGKSTVYEAHLSGFRSIDWKSFKKSNKIIATKALNWDMSAGVKLAQSWVGKKAYDLDELVGNVWVLIGKWLGRKFSNPFHDCKELDCSQSMTLVLQKVKFPDSEKFVAYNTSPQDLLNFLNSSHYSS